ncbi:hypothetical protein D3C81_1807820 [compost metagenome]
MSSSVKVMVKDSHFVLSISPQNTSGWPKSGDLAASFSHRLQQPRSVTERFRTAGWSRSPKVEFSVIEPFVTMTRSLREVEMVLGAPFTRTWMAVTVFSPPLKSTSRSTT